MLSIAFLVSHKPLFCWQMNYLELFNELYVLATAYKLLLYTDFVLSVETKYHIIGTFHVYSLISTFGLNILIIFGMFSLILYKKGKGKYTERAKKI